jgi:hypothetical protein
VRACSRTAKKKPKASLPWAESTVEEVEETIGAARVGLERAIFANRSKRV